MTENMNLLRYHRKTWPESALKNHIRAYTGRYVDEMTSEAIDDWMRGRWVMRRGRPQPVAPLWRLTMPVFLIVWALLALVVLPIRWVITGRYLLDEKSRLLAVLRPWAKRLFPVLLD